MISLNAQYFVDKDATGNNDGSSWANAYTNLDTALFYWDVTQYQEIWVADGVYKPGDGVDRTKAFNTKTNMFGGFNGTETSRGQRDPKVNLTILSGDLLGNDNGIISATEPTRADNSYSVVYTNSALQFTGFIIEGGQADASSGSDQHKSGAAFYSYNNGANIYDCVFRNNYGSEDGAIVKYRGPTSYNSTFNIHGNEFYNNVSYRSQISSTRISAVTHWAYINIYNNLFHHNTVEDSEASIILATTHVNGGSQSMGDYEYLIYYNTFANNTIPTTGGTIGHGRNVLNSNWSNTCDLRIEVVGNIIWDDAQPLVWTSMATGVIENSSQFYFMSNVIKSTDTIFDADLKSDLAYSLGNVYGQFPMFEDTTMNDYRILHCSAPGNDISNYLNQSLTISTDFYANPRLVGFASDAGHCEVQQAAATVVIQQVGATLEATAGFAGYNWVLGQNPYTQYTETSNVLTPSNGDGPYIVAVIDTNMCRNSASIDFCASNTVSIALVGDSLVATGVGLGNSYTWDHGGVNVGSGSSHTPTSSGVYKVYFFEFDGQQAIGCSGSAIYEVTCDNEPQALISQNGTTLEVNDDFTSYQWKQNGLDLAAEISATFSPAEDGDYQVVATGRFGCTSFSQIFSYCSSVSVSVSENNGTLEATAGFVSYQWYQVGGVGTGIVGATSSTYTPTEEGTYYCDASDANCTGTSNIIVFSTTSIANFGNGNKLNLNIFPNPASSVLNITSDFEIEEIVIYNISGKAMLTVATAKTIDISRLETGIYFIKVNSAKGSLVQKLIKK